MYVGIFLGKKHVNAIQLHSFCHTLTTLSVSVHFKMDTTLGSLSLITQQGQYDTVLSHPDHTYFSFYFTVNCHTQIAMKMKQCH